MQNIGKTDINSPGSTSQKEPRKERPLQAGRNRRQARLIAETKEQREAKLEADRDTTAWTTTDIRAKATSSCSKKTK